MPAFPDLRRAFEGRRVLVTGHTGFKGAWLSLWLAELGAEVHGVALPPKPVEADEGEGIFEAARVTELVDHRVGDIRDAASLNDALKGLDPELIFHLAAQPLVRASYRDPVDTYLTNVVGTANVLQAARSMPRLKACVVVSSDKCYDNREWVWGYRETDAMGGADPYSASKGCAELVTESFRRSFFAGADSARIASARAGNVIGGGDWAPDRLLPDMMRTIPARRVMTVRNPAAIRPWQHVLDPLRGYLGLAAGLLHGDEASASWTSGWNFGPPASTAADVREVAGLVERHWPPAAAAPVIEFAKAADDGGAFHEATTLRLDSTKAETLMGWRPLFDLDTAIARTVEWYAAQASGADMRAVCREQIGHFQGEHDARLAA